MKRSFLVSYLVLAAEAVFCVFSALHQTAVRTFSLTLLRFPWVPLADLIRSLSLSGSGGNLLAWGIYLMICTAPLFIGLIFPRRKLQPADASLLLWPVAAFPILYLLINPALLAGRFPLSFDIGIARILYSGLLWGIPLAWITLRFLAVRGAQQLHKRIRLLLLAVDAVLVAKAFGTDVLALRASLCSLSASNTALAPQQLLPTRTFFFFCYIGELLPCLLSLFIIHHLILLLEAAELDRYSAAVIAAAAHLATLCRGAVLCTLAVQLLLFSAQLLFSPLLYDIQLQWSLPLTPVGLSLGSLLLSQWLAEGKALKDENEGFI